MSLSHVGSRLYLPRPSPFTSLSHFFSISFGTVSSPSERLRRDTDRTGEEESDVRRLTTRSFSSFTHFVRRL